MIVIYFLFYVTLSFLLCGLVKIFPFTCVLSGGTSCSTCSLFNSLSDSFALSFSCRCSSSLEFSPPFCCSTKDVSACSEQRESNPLFVSLKIGLTILNHSGSSVKTNPGQVSFLWIIFCHCCFSYCKGFTSTTKLVSFFFL